MKPEYRLTANKTDITGKISERLVSLRYTDEAGMESDVLEIVLADHDPKNPIQVPATGAELELALGYDGDLDRIGLFVCDEIEMAGWPGEMTIRARAAPFDVSKGGLANLQTQKTHSWSKGTLLGDMVRKIAKEHGMAPAVMDTLAKIALPHIDQADESDLHFLGRVVKKYDGIVKPAAGKLVLAKIGSAKTISGLTLPTVTLGPGDVSRFRVVMSKRETAGMVVAYWHAVKNSRRNEVKVGTGSPGASQGHGVGDTARPHRPGGRRPGDPAGLPRWRGRRVEHHQGRAFAGRKRLHDHDRGGTAERRRSARR